MKDSSCLIKITTWIHVRADESELMCHIYRNKSCTSNKNISNSIGFVVFRFWNSLQPEKKQFDSPNSWLFYQPLLVFQSHANNSIPVLLFSYFFCVSHSTLCVVYSFNKHIPIFFFLFVVIYCDCDIRTHYAFHVNNVIFVSLWWNERKKKFISFLFSFFLFTFFFWFFKVDVVVKQFHLLTHFEENPEFIVVVRGAIKDFVFSIIYYYIPFYNNATQFILYIEIFYVIQQNVCDIFGKWQYFHTLDCIVSSMEQYRDTNWNLNWIIDWIKPGFAWVKQYIQTEYWEVNWMK